MRDQNVLLRLLDLSRIARIFAEILDELTGPAAPVQSPEIFFYLRRFGGIVGRREDRDWSPERIGRNECGVDGGSAGYQRPTRPPEMKSRDMALANGLLPRCFGTHILDREVILDQPASLPGHVPALLSRPQDITSIRQSVHPECPQVIVCYLYCRSRLPSPPFQVTVYWRSGRGSPFFEKNSRHSLLADHP